jgi:hypothetical protein
MGLGTRVNIESQVSRNSRSSIGHSNSRSLLVFGFDLSNLRTARTAGRHHLLPEADELAQILRLTEAEADVEVVVKVLLVIRGDLVFVEPNAALMHIISNHLGFDRLRGSQKVGHGVAAGTQLDGSLAGINVQINIIGD